MKQADLVKALEKAGCVVYTRGLPDSLVQLPGKEKHIIWAEFKGSHDTLSEHQKAFHRYAKKQDITIHVIRSVGDALNLVLGDSDESYALSQKLRGPCVDLHDLGEDLDRLDATEKKLKGEIATVDGRFQAARFLLEEAKSACRELDDVKSLRRELHGLSREAQSTWKRLERSIERQDWDALKEVGEQALALCKRHDTLRAEVKAAIGPIGDAENGYGSDCDGKKTVAKQAEAIIQGLSDHDWSVYERTKRRLKLKPIVWRRMREAILRSEWFNNYRTGIMIEFLIKENLPTRAIREISRREDVELVEKYCFTLGSSHPSEFATATRKVILGVLDDVVPQGTYAKVANAINEMTQIPSMVEAAYAIVDTIRAQHPNYKALQARLNVIFPPSNELSPQPSNAASSLNAINQNIQPEPRSPSHQQPDVPASPETVGSR